MEINMKLYGKIMCGFLTAAMLAGGLAAGILCTGGKSKRKREARKRKKTIGKIHEFI